MKFIARCHIAGLGGGWFWSDLQCLSLAGNVTAFPARIPDPAACAICPFAFWHLPV